MKMINFSFENGTFCYKFDDNEPITDTDNITRQRLSIASNSIYFLLDTSESTFISLPTLAFLQDETKISI